jgi:lipid-binding SYLF domain-containing protein
MGSRSKNMGSGSSLSYVKGEEMNAIRLFAITFITSIVVSGCATAPESPQAQAVLSAQGSEAIALFKEKDPSIERFFKQSYGYAVLPRIFKGAIWLGGAYGKGEVYEKGQMVGYCDMSQATLGFSFGGEYFRELIFFRDKSDLDRFKMDQYAFSAQVTGVAVTAGTAAKIDYKSGMAVFVMPDEGLMIDVSLGGQRFNYVTAFTIVDTTKK